MTDTCVLAIKATNGGGPGGILLSTDTGVVSDETWKCSATEQAGWYLEEFDDSGWDNAYVVGNYGDPTWPFPDGTERLDEISTSAKWIWDTGYHGTDAQTTYCRKTICDSM